MDPVILVIMLVSGAGMVFAFSKQKSGSAWGKPVAVVFALATVACAVLNVFKEANKGGGLEENQRAFRRVRGERLGLYLADKCPGSNVLLICDPANEDDTQQDALVDGLMKGLGSLQVTKLYPTIPDRVIKAYRRGVPADEIEDEMLPPADVWLTPYLFEDLVLEQGKGCDLVVTVIGLPENPEPMTRLWYAVKKKNVKVVVADGGVFHLEKALESGMIFAAVGYNPDVSHKNMKAPKDLNKAFAQRYLLLDSNTVGEIAEKHPNLFR